MRPRGADESTEERMTVPRRRGELRMELRREEPGVVGQLDDFHQAIAREPGETQARLPVALQVGIVELVAVPVAFENDVLAEDLARLAAGCEQDFLCAE